MKSPTIREVIAGMDFGRFGIPIRLEANEWLRDEIQISVKLQVENSDGSGPTEITHREYFSFHELACVARNLDLDRLFTHRWRLDQAEEAYRIFDAQASGKGAFIF